MRDHRHQGRRPRRSVVLVAVATALLLLLTAAPAPAAPTTSSGDRGTLPSVVTRVVHPMKAVPADKFDRRTGLVEVSPGKWAEPDDTRYGNCGYSWYYLTGGNNRYYHYTGFVIYNNYPPATGYDWDVNVVGPFGYNRNWSWGGGLLLRRRWDSGTRSAYVDDTGYYNGRVTFGAAYLLYGYICISANPRDTGFVS
jgi:hypothetical protein